MDIQRLPNIIAASAYWLVVGWSFYSHLVTTSVAGLVAGSSISGPRIAILSIEAVMVKIDRSCRVIPNNSAGAHMENPGCHCSYNHHIHKVLQIWLWGFWCIQVSHYSHKTSGQSRRPYQHHGLSRWRYWPYRGPWHANRRPGWLYSREWLGPAMWSHHRICLAGLLRDRRCLLFVNQWT